jgi:hypothetical protein
MEVAAPPASASSGLLVEGFRSHYTRLEHAVSVSVTNEFGDSVVLARIGDDLDEFLKRFQQVGTLVANVPIVLTSLVKHVRLFSSEEMNTICRNVSLLQMEVRIAYQRALDASHNGFRCLVSEVQGATGRPRIVIDETFLRWAYAYRSTSGIAAFLRVSRPVVRNALLQYGIVEPAENPIIRVPLRSEGPNARTASSGAFHCLSNPIIIGFID